MHELRFPLTYEQIAAIASEWVALARSAPQDEATQRVAEDVIRLQGGFWHPAPLVADRLGYARVTLRNAVRSGRLAARRRGRVALVNINAAVAVLTPPRRRLRKDKG